MTRFYSVLPDKGHKSRKSFRIWFEFQPLELPMAVLGRNGKFGQIWARKGRKWFVCPKKPYMVEDSPDISLQ